jgi:hypothetical protein
MMKKSLLLLGLLTVAALLNAQKATNIITVAEVQRIEKVLAADDMRGRLVFTPGIEKAANFIAAEFKTAGLLPWADTDSYLQNIVMIQSDFISGSATLDGKLMDQRDVLVITPEATVKIDEHSGFEKVDVKAGSDFSGEIRKVFRADKNYLVIIDTSFRSVFPRLASLKSAVYKGAKTIVFILAGHTPSTFSVEASHKITEQKMANVVGILPGKSRKDEYVIFSGHYDHLGVTDSPVNGDSVFNGANDDASGTTAVLMLARYFKALGNNERTLVFAAFTAEESGGFGSQFFSKQFQPEKVIAMFNIEMIGTKSKWGGNSAYITGYEKSNMGTILQRNLQGTGFRFYPDPYPDQQLFYRSDNARLARLGVPAHTISTSKMDNEPNYHKLSDQVKTLDLKNMTMIIRSIGISARSIIAGTDTPSRVNVNDLK